MIDWSMVKAEHDRLFPPRTKVETMECPDCQEEVRILTVKKVGKNQGRLFIACKNCDLFRFLDEPEPKKCGKCGASMPLLTAKTIKNWGRTSTLAVTIAVVVFAGQGRNEPKGRKARWEDSAAGLSPIVGDGSLQCNALHKITLPANQDCASRAQKSSSDASHAIRELMRTC